MKDLDYYLKRTENASKDGIYGIDACKKCVKEMICLNKKFNAHYQNNNCPDNYKDLLNHFIKRANEDIFFNENMIRACYELAKGGAEV